ncbi:MAG: aminotransferase class V-fold PLP-dependent enzyme [Oscillospiraceae bacterium]
MVNFDNAATTFPKPETVTAAMEEALLKYGGNPGRSGHKLSLQTAEAVYSTRKICADFFGAEPENVVFTLNCTHALNYAIKGAMRENGHIITSDLEHNSVIRPINSLTKNGAEYSIAHVFPDDEKTLCSFEELIRPDTKLIVCTAASNVTGQRLPIEQIAKLCDRKNICFIVDAAQGAGVIPIKIGGGINFICAPGHKGLYGPSGTGILVSDGKYSLKPIIEGGTGSLSMDINQPDFLPDALESGTVNTAGIYALGKGVEFVMQTGLKEIFCHEEMLCQRFLRGLQKIDGTKAYRHKGALYVPIVSFNAEGFSSNELASLLGEEGFCLRGGLHCAGIAHTAIGTAPDGTVRFAPSVFSTAKEVDDLLFCLKKILQKP